MILEEEGAGGGAFWAVLRQLEGRFAVLCRSLCLEMVPSVAGVNQSTEGLLWLPSALSPPRPLSAGAAVGAAASVTAGAARTGRRSKSPWEGRRQGSMSPSWPGDSTVLGKQPGVMGRGHWWCLWC